MFEDRFVGFNGDFNILRRGAPDLHHLPPSDDRFLDTDPFLKNHCNIASNGFDLCQKLNKMGISCDTTIWSKPEPFRVDPVGFRSTASLHGAFSSGLDYNLRHGFSSGFLHNATSHGGEELRLLALQDSLNPNRDLLLNRSSPPPPPCILSNDAFMGFFDENRASLASSYPHERRVSRALAAMEGASSLRRNHMFMGLFDENIAHERRVSGSCSMMGSKRNSSIDLPMNLASMVSIYGSVSLMAKDQIGCRVLQKFVDEGTFHDAKAIFFEIVNNVNELSMDPFGNYIVQKLFDACHEEQRTMLVSVLTSKPMELIKICLNTYGTRVVQKMIETVKTKQQIEMVKSGLKPGFLALVKDLNGNHVIQTCLTSLSPNNNKFVLEAATNYCAEIATHRHGCCVLQCCVSNSFGEQRERLVDEISRNSLHLSLDPFGNYVVQFLIEPKVPAVKLLIQFRTHYAKLAVQKYSSHVVEKCLRIYPESRAEIVRELLSVQNFEHLLQDPFGNYVIQTALSVTKGPVRARLVEIVQRYGKLKSSPYCKKIFSKTTSKN
ncbi:unnamed protein product [Cochlearia groenlandica]